jgi:hypothetical protein
VPCGDRGVAAPPVPGSVPEISGYPGVGERPPDVTVVKIPEDGQAPETTIDSQASEKPPKLQPTADGSKTEKPHSEITVAGPKIRLLKWLGLVAFVIVGLIIYGIYLGRPVGPGPGDPPPSELARNAALGALRQGNSLSLAISKMPKLEKVMQSAQKLANISPRYQEYVTDAQRSLRETNERWDNCLKTYISKVLELSRYSPQQINSAMETVLNGDLTPREKIVTELLTRHVNSLKNNADPDPAQWLADFKARFGNFVD